MLRPDTVRSAIGIAPSIGECGRIEQFVIFTSPFPPFGESGQTIYTFYDNDLTGTPPDLLFTFLFIFH